MSNVPVYPNFKPILLEDKPLFEAALAKDPAQTSEMSFTGFYTWAAIEKAGFSLLDRLIIVKQGAANPPQFYEPIGAGRKKEAIARVLKDNRGAFIAVSYATAKLFKGEREFYCKAEREHFDYLYRVADLAALSGEKYDGKRNLIRRFKAGQAYEYVVFGPGNAEECLAFEDSWCAIKGCDEAQGLKDERETLRLMVSDFSRLGLTGAGIKIDSRLCAFIIAGRLNRETLLVHILKAYPDIVGLYQTMLNEFLIRQAGSFRYLNMEDDLGLAGLRKSKLSYHPVRLIDKYRITLSDGR